MKNKLFLKRPALIAGVFILLLFIAGCAGENNEPIDESQIQWVQYNERAEAFISFMVSDDFDGAVAMFDRTMERSLSAPMLKALWDEIVQHAGGFISFHDADNMLADGYFVCDITSAHENIGVTLRVVFDRNDLVAGFFIIDYPELP